MNYVEAVENFIDNIKGLTHDFRSKLEALENEKKIAIKGLIFIKTNVYFLKLLNNFFVFRKKRCYGEIGKFRKFKRRHRA